MIYGEALMTTREGLEEETTKKLKEESTCLTLDKSHSFLLFAEARAGTKGEGSCRE